MPSPLHWDTPNSSPSARGSNQQKYRRDLGEFLTGGNIDGMIKASETNVAAVTDKTIVIPGHGNPVSSKAELSAYRDMLVAIRDNVAKLKQQGHSLDETIAAKPTAAFDAKWGQFVVTPALFTRLVYEGV